MGSAPKIIAEGNPLCIHWEIVDADMIGTCRKCGRQRAYGQVSLLPAGMKDKQSKGGIQSAKNKPVGPANTESTIWVSTKGQKSFRTLIKGVDF